jgi:hypothetical protein
MKLRAEFPDTAVGFFVARDAQGTVVGRFRQKQEGVPEDFVLADDPQLYPVAELRAAALAAVNEAFDAAASAIVAPYPPAERLTWPIQEGEARGVQVDPLAPTPYIDALAASRGVDRLMVIQLVQQNSAGFRAQSAKIIGKRQKWRDAIQAAVDAAGIAAARDAGVKDLAA